MCGRDARDDLVSRFRGLWRGEWVWPPSPSGLPTGPPSHGPGVRVRGQGVEPRTRAGGGRVSSSAGAGTCALRARCGRAGLRIRPGASGYLRAHENRSKFRPGVCAGLDPFSAHQFPALPICS